MFCNTFIEREYRIFSIKRPRRSFKNRQIGPGVYLKLEFNRGPAFINEVYFCIKLRPGLFFITERNSNKYALTCRRKSRFETEQKR